MPAEWRAVLDGFTSLGVIALVVVIVILAAVSLIGDRPQPPGPAATGSGRTGGIHG